MKGASNQCLPYIRNLCKILLFTVVTDALC